MFSDIIDWESSSLTEQKQMLSVDMKNSQNLEVEPFFPIQQKEMPLKRIPPIDKPKRNRSAYNFFVIKERERIYRDRETGKKKPGFGELARSIAKEWKNLDPMNR